MNKLSLRLCILLSINSMIRSIYKVQYNISVPIIASDSCLQQHVSTVSVKDPLARTEDPVWEQIQIPLSF